MAKRGTACYILTNQRVLKYDYENKTPSNLLFSTVLREFDQTLNEDITNCIDELPSLHKQVKHDNLEKFDFFKFS